MISSAVVKVPIEVGLKDDDERESRKEKVAGKEVEAEKCRGEKLYVQKGRQAN